MEKLHYLLMKSHGIINKKILAGALEMGLTAGQPKILEYLLKYEGKDQKSIATYCEIEQTTVGSLLLRMEEAQLIIRKQHAGNRRSLFVYLTERGRQAAKDMEKIFAASEKQMTQNLSESEVETLKKILTKMCGEN